MPCRVDDATVVRCGRLEAVGGRRSLGDRAAHRVVRCSLGGTSIRDASTLNVLHVGAFDNNVGDNLALDHVQHHVSSILLQEHQPQPNNAPPATTAVAFHILDIDHHFLSQGNPMRATLAMLKR